MYNRGKLRKSREFMQIILSACQSNWNLESWRRRSDALFNLLRKLVESRCRKAGRVTAKSVQTTIYDILVQVGKEREAERLLASSLRASELDFESI